MYWPQQVRPVHRRYLTAVASTQTLPQAYFWHEVLVSKIEKIQFCISKVKCTLELDVQVVL